MINLLISIVVLVVDKLPGANRELARVIITHLNKVKQLYALLDYH